MPGDAGYAVFELRGDTKDFDSAMDRSERKAGGLMGIADKLGSAFKVGALAAAGGLAVLGGAVGVVGIGFDSMMQQAEISFTTMLGSTEKAKSMLADLQKFAASTPFEMKGLIQSSQQLLAFGFQSKDIIPMLTSIGDAVAGLGGDPANLDRVTRAIGQMQAKGKVASGEMMQLAEVGIPAWDMLAKKMGKTVPEVLALVEKGAVDSKTGIDAVIQGMEDRFGGLMEKQSHTFGGLLSTIKDTFSQVSGQVMKPFFEMATSGMQKLVDLTSKESFTAGVQKFADTLAKVSSAGFSLLGKGIDAVLPTARTFVEMLKGMHENFWLVYNGQVKMAGIWGTLQSAISKTIGFLVGLASALKGEGVTSDGFVGAGERVGVVLLQVADAAQKVLAAVVPFAVKFAGVVGDIVQFAVKSGLLGDALEGVRVIALGFFKALEVGIKFVTEHKTLMYGLAVALGILLVYLNPIPAAILAIVVAVGFLSKHWDEIKKKTEEVWNSIPGPIRKAIEFFVAFTKTKIQGFIQAFTAVYEIVKNVVGLVKNVLEGDWKAAWQNLKNIVSAVVDLVIGYIKMQFGNLPQILLGLAGQLGQAALTLAGQLWGNITSGARSVLDFVTALPGQIAQLLATGFSAAVGAVTSAAASLWSALTAGAQAVLDFIVQNFTAEKIGYALAFVVTLPLRLFREGLQAGLPVLVEFFGTTLPNLITQTIPQLAAKALELGKGVIDGIWNAIKTGWEAGKTFFTDTLPNFIGSTAVTAATKAKDIGVKVVEAIWSAIKSGWDAGKTFFTQTIPDFITQSIPNAGAKALELGKKIIGSVVDGIKGAISTIRELPSDIAHAFVDGFTGFASMWQGVGKAIVDGVWQGIKNAEGWFKSQVTGFFKGIVGGVKSALGIGSPSREGVYIGEMFTKGVAIGLAQLANLNPMQYLGDMMPSEAPRASVAPIQTQGQLDAVRMATSAGPAPTGGGGPVNVYQNNQISYPTIEQIIEALMQKTEELDRQMRYNALRGGSPLSSRIQ